MDQFNLQIFLVSLGSSKFSSVSIILSKDIWDVLMSPLYTMIALGNW